MNSWYNKSIALVGNAQSIFNHNHGFVIDSHQVICRFNQGGIILDSKSQGSRTDILFVNDFKYFGHIPGNKIQIHDLDIGDLKEQLGHDRPSSGLRAIYHMIQCSPSKLSLFGFDSKATPTYYLDSKNEPHDYQNEKRFIRKLFSQYDFLRSPHEYYG